MEKLSSTLKQLLNSANISEAELARRTGIAQPMVNRLATGKNKNPKLETLKPIAKYFSVTFSQLLGEEELPNLDGLEKVTSNTTSTTFQLPVISWSTLNIDNISSEKMVATTVNVSEKAFALLVEDAHLEPRFSVNSLLTIEPTVAYNNNDFVLVKDNQTNALELKQVKQDGDSTLLQGMDSNSNLTNLTEDRYTLIGVLVQSRHDYK